MLRLTQLATAAVLVVNALAAGAPVMNADDCNATDPNQLWRVNAAHGAASHQLTVTVGGADFCAATTAAGDCSVSDFAFVNSTECAPAICAFAQGFDVIDKVTKQPAPKGQECAKCLVRSKLNSSLCFGVGAMLGSADWKVSAADATGLQTFEMLETDTPICLGSGLGPQGPFGPTVSDLAAGVRVRSEGAVRTAGAHPPIAQARGLVPSGTDNLVLGTADGLCVIGSPVCGNLRDRVPRAKCVR